VSGAPAQSTSWTSAGRAQQVRQALLAGDATDEDDGGAVGIDAQAADQLGVVDALPAVEVDPVVDDLDLRLVDRRVGAQDVAAHPVADRDDAVGGLVGLTLDPARDAVAASELFGLPGSERFEAVCRQDVRDPVQHLGQLAGRVRVPGVAVDDVGSGHVLGHADVHAEGAQRGVGLVELGQVGVPGRVGFGVDLAECTDLHLDALTQGLDEFDDVDARSPVDVGRVFLGDDIDSHVVHRSRATANRAILAPWHQRRSSASSWLVARANA